MRYLRNLHIQFIAYIKKAFSLPILALMSLLLLQLNAQAQISRYPVDASVLLTPPYSVYLSDYAEAANPLFRLNLRLTDQEKFNYQVKLRISIESLEGLTIRTRPGFVSTPIYLEPNQILSLTGADIAPYFNLNNLEVTGNGSNSVKNSGRLPESIYTVKVEVLDYSRNQVVSNVATTMAWIIMSQPPIPINPLDREMLEVFEMQRVRLTWAAQHQQLPNMGRIVYQVKVVELPDETTDPNNALLSLPPIINSQTYNTWFDIDFSVATLIPGKHYAWQIIASDEDGRSRFKNGGRSPVQQFQYGQLCFGPLDVSAESLDSRRIKISWDNNEGNTRYNIRYKEDAPNAEWFSTSDIYVKSATVNDLKPNTKYLYQIKGYCNVVPTEFSESYSIRTDEESAADFVCGVTPADWNLENVELLESLNKGDVFYAADFDIKVIEVSGGAGQYSGEGLVVVPMMNHMKIKVAFTNVKINTESRLVEGKVIVIGGVVQLLDDATRDKIFSIVENIDGLFDQLEDYLGSAAELLDVIDGINETIDNLQNDEGLPDEVADALDEAGVKLGEAAEALASGDVSGAIDLVEEAANIVKDALAEVGAQPNTPDPGPDSGNTVPLYDGNPVLANFAPSAQQKYGFDAVRDNYALVNYPQQEILGNNYKMAYKAISSTDLEYLDAGFSGNNDIGQYIGYRTSYMTTTKMGEASQNKQSLSLLGTGDGQDDELVAFMKVLNEEDKEEEVITGAIKIASYQPGTEQLMVVPVNGATYPFNEGNLQQKLNDIYKQALTGFSVTVAPDFAVSDWDENDDRKLDNGASGMLSNYPKEMRNILRAYKNEKGFTDNTYYIFLVKEPENTNRVAYMPRKKQAGFVFTDKHNTEEEIVTTIAHELGHGAFRLEHTFVNGTVAPNSTDNLMDYNGGKFLHKYQWDLIHNPVSMITLFDADEDGAYDMSDNTLYYKIIQEVRCSLYSGDNFEGQQYIDRVPTSDKRNILMNLSQVGKIAIVTSNSTELLRNINSETGNYSITVHTTPRDGAAIKHNFTYKIDFGSFTLFSEQNLADYFNPTEASLKADLETVISGINDIDNLTDGDIDNLKTIAACSSTFLDTDTRYRLIKAILNNSFFNTLEYKEDLVLDLIRTTQSGADSKSLYNKISSDNSLIEELLDDLDNITGGKGNENNYDRLAIEYITLFYKGFTSAELENLYNDPNVIPNDYKIFFNGFSENSSLICAPWLIEATKNGSQVKFNENIQKTNAQNTHGAGSIQPCVIIGSEEYTLDLNKLVAIDVSATLSEELGITSGIYVMPVFAYYVLVSADQNQKLKEAVETFVFIAGLVTPFDEFYFLGKALRLAKTAVRSTRFSKVKNVAESGGNKIVVELDADGLKLKTDSDGKLVDFVDFKAIGGTGKSAILEKLNALGDLTHAKNFVNSLDDVADASILSNLNNIGNAQLQKLNTFYKNRPSPEGFSKTDFDFTATKVLENGNEVSVTFKHGLPDFRNHSPSFNFTDGTPVGKFKYQSQNLTGYGTDFKEANTALAKKFGIEKVNNQWPQTNAEGYLQNGDFRWRKTGTNFSQRFELLENGEWVEYTWHHFEDGTTMFPVKSSIHSTSDGGFAHPGGGAILGDGTVTLKDIFNFSGF
ncbi:fibronectin type III domain-containing protein [Marivirga sp. S37H4]|uniref:Fibronectin type III domain-containing protein n=1 Tax=Marivirga aurantiaca TaxID=2802615 RepID=A0A934WXG5_9BACT|nr:fibronectin type III domain-containing protein [Marivirga aurantiaca]MBK6264769.1 fibronectin type III domain-containing protein [Marivirga aurantiaca]